MSWRSIAEQYYARIAELEGEVAEANSGRYQDAARSVSANTRATTKLEARIAELEAERDVYKASRFGEQARRIRELEAQLPEGMKNCTILFKECEKGHGRLTATNWIDHGCEYCRIAELEAERDRLTAMVMNAQHALDEVGAGIARRVLEEREACLAIMQKYDSPEIREIRNAIRARPTP